MDNYRQAKFEEIEDTFWEFGTSLSREKIKEIGEWYILEIKKLKKKKKEAENAIEELIITQGLFKDINEDKKEQERKNNFIILYQIAVNKRLHEIFITDITAACNDIIFKENYEWNNFLNGVTALAEKWDDWVC